MRKINSFLPQNHPYTQQIISIANSPKRLWLDGILPSTRVPSVVIVGTRKPTPYGKEVTYQLSYELAKRGVVIISGLALGVDGIAHQAALDAGGRTIAVLPTPIESIHPRMHRELAERIALNGGALLSEYGAEDPVFKANFVARNRIVTALSDGLLITEAAVRSGTLTTARFALEQGKPVMVVPGNITSPLSIGCNSLLKVGAAPITDVDDVLHELGLRDTTRQAALPLGANHEEAIILALLHSGVRDGDELHQKSNLTAALFNQTMTMLEINGAIRSLGANQWAIRQ
jgi:DNA processing protein